MTLAFLVAAWLAGLLLGIRLEVTALPILLLALAMLSLGGLLRLSGRGASLAILAGVLLLGLFRVEVTGDPTTGLVLHESQQVVLQGRIVDDPETTPRRFKFALEVDAVDRGEGWQTQSGKILAYADPPASLVSVRDPPYFRYGDALTLQGELRRPQPIEDFDYPSYLANQGFSGIFWVRQVEWVSEGGGNFWLRGIYDVRRWLSRSLGSALPEPQSSLAQALLLGIRGQIPSEVVEQFRSTGTSHLLAISGLHVGILLVLCLSAAGWMLGRQRQIYLLVPLAAIWFYALISGLPPSVVRAAIMGSIFLGALALGRPRSILPALAFGGALMTAVDPRVLTQVSFQLSFAAMAGIVLALPYQASIREKITGGPDAEGIWWQVWLRYIAGWTAAALIVSLVATLATLPLVAFNFHRIPLFGIVVTALALPSLPFILAGSLGTALAGLIHPVLGQMLGWLAWVPLSYLVELVSLAPGTTISGGWVGGPLIWAWYLILGGLLLLPGGLSYLQNLRSRVNFRIEGLASSSLPHLRPNGKTLGVLGGAIILAVSGTLLWAQVFSGSDGKLHVYFFDVGQGDSILIVSPGGRQLLVDGGPDAASGVRALSGSLTPWDRSLDLVALTHMDSDHGRGLLEVLNRYQVGMVLVGLEQPGASLYPQWRAALAGQQLMATPVRAGYRILLDDDVILEVLHPPASPFLESFSEQNNNGLVLRLVYHEVSFLLTADIEAEAEIYLLREAELLEADVLKVAHHGSKTSTTTAFLEAVNPSAAVISAGEDNRFGHPHLPVLARLKQQVTEGGIYQTSQQGRIEFISDGTGLWVKTER